MAAEVVVVVAGANLGQAGAAAAGRVTSLASLRAGQRRTGRPSHGIPSCGSEPQVVIDIFIIVITFGISKRESHVAS